DVRELLVQVAQLNEKSDADSHALEPLPGRDDLIYRRTFVHGVQHAVTAALGAQPGFLASRGGERGCHALTEKVGPCLDRERDTSSAGRDGLRELVHPVNPESKDVV